MHKEGGIMNEKKSSIDSFSVSFGHAKNNVPNAKHLKLEPWNIFICSDLGFKSQKPAQVKIAEWNEFMESCGVELAGAGGEGAEAGVAAPWVEYKVTSMRDFSPQSVAAGAFPAESRMLDALQRLLDGKLSINEARDAVEKTSLSAEEKNRIRALLRERGASTGQEQHRPAAGSPLSAILSMVDTDSDSSPKDASAALIGSIADAGRTEFDVKGLASYVETGRGQLHGHIAAIHDQPFFASRKASWSCLQRCAKVVGRRQSANLYVYSSPREDFEERFANIVSELVDTAGAPDIILWDFAVSFTNADMVGAKALAQTADTFKCMLLAHLTTTDQLFQGIESRDSLAPMLREPRFLPLNTLRADAAARCLCLCGPSAIIAETADSGPALTIAGCWPVLIRWLEMLVDDNNPYAVQRSGIVAEPRESDGIDFYPRISLAIRQEAALYAGLSFFAATAVSATIDKCVTVIDPENAGAAYASCCFNMLINRVARLSTVKLLGRPGSMGAEEAAYYLGQLLREELMAYGVCSSQDQIAVKPNSDQTVEIQLASDVAIGGVPARFSFTMEL